MPLVCVTGTSDALEDGVLAGREAAERALAKAAVPARRVVVVFASVQLDLKGVLEGVKSVLDAPVIGCTTYSEATEEGYNNDSVSLMVIGSDGLEIGLGIGENLASDVRGAAERAWSQASRTLSGPASVVLAFPDAALSYKGEAVVEALDEVTGGVPLAGGCPGDGGKFQKTFQLFDGKVYSDSLPLLALGGDVGAVVVTRTGWRPMGEKGRVTEVSGNRVKRIDGAPSIDFVRKYLGQTPAPEIMGTFPFALIEHSVEHEGQTYYVIRSPFFYEESTDSIAFGGLFPDGALVQMGKSPREVVLASAEEAGKALRKRLGGKHLGGAIFASCGGRMLAMGLATSKEVQVIAQELGGETPIAGFYSYGELGAFDSTDPALDRPRYHNCTLVLCGLVEKTA